jgi:hypothetical protein
MSQQSAILTDIIIAFLSLSKKNLHNQTKITSFHIFLNS